MAEEITVQAEQSEEKQADGKSIVGFFGSIIPYFKPYRGWLTLILGAMAANLAFESYLPLSFEFLMEKAPDVREPIDQSIAGRILTNAEL
jgi:hypothetical protein